MVDFCLDTRASKRAPPANDHKSVFPPRPHTRPHPWTSNSGPSARAPAQAAADIESLDHDARLDPSNGDTNTRRKTLPYITRVVQYA